MDQVTASFIGTLAYGRLALLMLFVANLGAWLMHDAAAGLWGLLSAIGATTLAYASQSAFTANNQELGRRVMLASIAVAFLSAVFLIQSGN